MRDNMGYMGYVGYHGIRSKAPHRMDGFIY